MANKNPFQSNIQKSTKFDTASKETRALQSGIGNKKQLESKFIYNSANNETILGGNDNNAYIVFGKDRPSSKMSGYGGEGSTQNSTIDIVAGRMSPVINNEDKQLFVDSNNTLDAARIYISQKTDVDINFGLVDGQVGNSKAKSAIAMKADGLRFIAREGIKFVTKTDVNNSAGIEVTQHSGIDLIANNDDSKLQPMLMGEYTTQLFRELIDEVDKLQNRVEYFIDEQQKFNNAVSTHTHYSPFFGQPTTLSPDLAIKNGFLVVKKLLNVDVGYYFQKVNFGGLINKYLENGEFSIKSKYNRVN
jgi:hypothetical protein